MLQKPSTSKASASPKRRAKRKASKSPNKLSVSKEKALKECGLSSFLSSASSKSSFSNRNSENRDSFNDEEHETISVRSEVDDQDKSYLEHLVLENSGAPLDASSPKKLSKESKKNGKKRKNYKFVKTFNELSEVDAYVRTVSINGYKVSHNNGLVKCSICPHNFDKHERDQRYWKCACGDKSCELGWKVNKCENNNTWYFAQTGELHEKDYVKVRAPNQLPKKRYGIAINVKIIYTKWLDKNDSLTALDLRNRLIGKIKANKDLPKNDSSRNEMYCFSKNLIPSLKQVEIIIILFLFFNFDQSIN